MYLEHGMVDPEEEIELVKNGGVTFTSFIIFGSIPLLTFFIICHIDQNYYNISFWVSTIVTCITMFLLGVCQAIICSQPVIKNGFTVMGSGIIATSCGYFIGYALESSFI